MLLDQDALVRSAIWFLAKIKGWMMDLLMDNLILFFSAYHIFCVLRTYCAGTSACGTRTLPGGQWLLRHRMIWLPKKGSTAAVGQKCQQQSSTQPLLSLLTNWLSDLRSKVLSLWDNSICNGPRWIWFHQIWSRGEKKECFQRESCWQRISVSWITW